MLSDGANTTGDYQPLEAAQKAADAGVPVYTVALGTDAGTVEGPDGYGGTRTIRVPPDPATLSQVAEMTGGSFFEAADGDALRSVYDEIGSQVGVETEQRELTVFFTAAGRGPVSPRGGALDALVRAVAVSAWSRLRCGWDRIAVAAGRGSGSRAPAGGHSSARLRRRAAIRASSAARRSRATS